ncbi:MAG: HEPN domain-containing protein [Candidatus Rokubacteria bacterium]|nr:HEPN domain-containing protein [Candidatus Rokubacteria bacterium]
MPREADVEALARAWLRRARSNLALAKQPKPPEVVWEDLCFEAQQAAEKAVKAVLVKHQIAFPKTHDLGVLLGLLEQGVPAVPDVLWEGRDLSRFATAARYPEGTTPATEADHRDAVRIADEAVRWAQGQFDA